MESEILKELENGPRFNENFTAKDREALKELSSNQNIIIKEADKGSGIVLMDRDRYITEGLRQLNDVSTYRKLDSDPSRELESELRDLVEQSFIDDTLTKDMADYAIPTSHKLARFYLLPKVHKPGVPGRPVISGCGSLTEKVSEIVDYLIKPYLPSVTSYLKDTQDFLQKVRRLGPIPQGSLLMTLDVVSLYPSIPHSDGLSALAEFLAERGLPEKHRTNICNLAKFVLTNNVFEFDSDIYLQVSGTAIGTRMAPTYAIIFLHMFESKFLKSASLNPYIWYRFIDDIFSIWQHGEARLRAFTTELNARHPSIQFTWDVSESLVPFLDVNVRLEDSAISTDLYVKPTDTHQYLHPASCHPGHVKRSIPFSQAWRILTICSDYKQAEKHISNLVQFLEKRGHNRTKVLKEVNKAKHKFRGLKDGHLPRTDTKNKDVPSSKSRRIPLVLTYHPGLPDISALCRRLLPVLHLNPAMKELCPEPPMLAFRKPPNLRSLLIRAKVPALDYKPTPKTCGPCSVKGLKKGRKCELCQCLPTQSKVVSSYTSKTYPLKLNSMADCDSTFVVYVIQCTTCPTKPQYVGQTSNFRKRMNNHKSCIRLGKDTDNDCSLLYEHFKLPNHSPQTVLFSIIEHCPDTRTLLLSETKWIWKLKTCQPFGLNINNGFL